MDPKLKIFLTTVRAALLMIVKGIERYAGMNGEGRQSISPPNGLPPPQLPKGITATPP